MEIVPLFASWGSAAGILYEVQKHRYDTQREELPPAGSFVKGALLGGMAGLAADIGLQYATRKREHKRSGTTGGHYRGGHKPNQAHSTNAPGKDKQPSSASSSWRSRPSGSVSSGREPL